jgi:pSer/pThr/pTyr-binding forkhead associated (FHA) protein
MLDIEPPEVRIRDLGSLNGTFVNGRLIGQRDRQKPATEDETEIILQDGDEMRVGSTVFRIGLGVPQATKEWDHAENDTFDPAACI